jgi:hypothetical protein
MLLVMMRICWSARPPPSTRLRAPWFFIGDAKVLDTSILYSRAINRIDTDYLRDRKPRQPLTLASTLHCTALLSQPPAASRVAAKPVLSHINWPLGCEKFYQCQHFSGSSREVGQEDADLSQLIAETARVPSELCPA